MVCAPDNCLKIKIMSDLNAFSEAMVDLVAKVSPSVVAVKAGAYRTITGIVIDSEHIAVPEHALKRRESIPFLTQTGDEAVAKILGRDPGVDLAILQVDGLKASAPKAAPAESLKPGMLAAVIGMTRDVGPSVSLGVLGAVGPARRTWRLGVLDQFVRLDVNLYPSQNGAAVVTASGDLVGMATPALSKHSTMAIPATTIQRIITELHTEGRIRMGYLGIGVQPVAIPESLQSKTPGGSQKLGLIILSVVPGSPADQGGLQVGDILLAFGEHSLEDPEHLQFLLRGQQVGKPIELTILRGGELINRTVIIQEAERK
jgi:S1-C subfamily serine protease